MDYLLQMAANNLLKKMNSSVLDILKLLFHMEKLRNLTTIHHYTTIHNYTPYLSFEVMFYNLVK